MKLKVTAILAFALFFTFTNSSIAQGQNGDVSSSLEALRITTNDNGEEVAQKASTIEPGDTLEYRLTYTNNLSGAISNLQAMLPIPAGAQYIVKTAKPVMDMASLDAVGNTFEPLPIQRNETQPDGSVQKVTVAATEYRRLRWIVPNLAAQASVTLTARVQVFNAIRQ